MFFIPIPLVKTHPIHKMTHFIHTLGKQWNSLVYTDCLCAFLFVYFIDIFMILMCGNI